MDQLSHLDKHLINSATEVIVVLRCLNPDNLYKAEFLLCQTWHRFEPSKRPAICTRFKWLAENDYLPIDPIEPGLDRKMQYRLLP
jgi:hypothetical protein